MNKKVLFSRYFIKKGILQVGHILNENGTLFNFQELSDKFGIDRSYFLFYMSVLRCIPMHWKNIIRGKSIGEINNGYKIKVNGKCVNLVETHNKVIYKSLTLKKMSRSKAFKNYTEQYNINNEKWKLIYRLPHELNISNKAKEMQYKILHNYVPTNQLLFKMNIIQSPRCNFCNLYDQTTPHLFFNCLVVKNFWFSVIAWLESDHETIIKLFL